MPPTQFDALGNPCLVPGRNGHGVAKEQDGQEPKKEKVWVLKEQLAQRAQPLHLVKAQKVTDPAATKKVRSPPKKGSNKRMSLTTKA